MSGPIEYEEDDVMLPKRTGCFATSEVPGKVLCQEYDPKHKLPKKRDRAALWYTKKDFREFRLIDGKAMSTVRKSNYHKSFLKVFHACASSEQLRNLNPKHMQKITDTKNRGYELQIFNSALIRHRKRVLNQILETQQQHYVLRQIMTDAERWEALGERCRELTKQSRRLAHLQGLGDSVAARVAGAELPNLAQNVHNSNDSLASPLKSPGRQKSKMAVLTHSLKKSPVLIEL